MELNDAKKIIDNICDEWKKKPQVDEDFFEGNKPKASIFCLEHGPLSFDNPVSVAMMDSTLSEGLIKTYPMDMTIKYIKEFFKLDDWQIIPNKNNGVSFIGVKMPNIADNIKQMEKAFNACGYYRGASKGFDVLNWVYLQFEPKYPPFANLEDQQYLVHLTPSYNAEKIKKIGFTPKMKNSLFNYPDRVYFLKGAGVKLRDMFNLKNLLSLANKSKGNKGEYVAFLVDLSKVPKDVKFYPDSNCDNGVYTTDNIPPTAISMEKILKG